MRALDVQASTGIAFIPFGALRAYRALNTLTSLSPLRASRASLPLRAPRPLGAHVTGITFYATRALGYPPTHRRRAI